MQWLFWRKFSSYRKNCVVMCFIPKTLTKMVWMDSWDMSRFWATYLISLNDFPSQFSSFWQYFHHSKMLKVDWNKASLQPRLSFLGILCSTHVLMFLIKLAHCRTSPIFSIVQSRKFIWKHKIESKLLFDSFIDF